VAKECELPLPGLDTVTVNRWVTGKQRPTAFYVRLLLALLDRLLLGAAMDTSLATRLEGVGRREFLLRVAAAAGLSALASVGRPPVNALADALQDAVVPHASQIDAAVGYLRRVFNEFDSADWLLGPQLQLPTVASHLSLLERLLTVARGESQSDLLKLRTRYAEFAGWLHQDSGQMSAAVWWTERALKSARDTGDSLMTSYLLVKKSVQAAAEGSPGLAIGFARTAQSGSSLTPKVRAVALQQEAHGLALIGSAEACQRKLDEALELSAKDSEQDHDGPARYCIPAFVQIWRATCLMELGKSREAIDIFERELALLPSGHYRDRGVYLGRLAVAYAGEGTPEAAIIPGRQAREVAKSTGSDRITRELRKLYGMLDRWEHVAEVADFRRDLAEAGLRR
jgi:tetratricopeptide (TPR) repeat protein